MAIHPRNVKRAWCRKIQKQNWFFYLAFRNQFFARESHFHSFCERNKKIYILSRWRRWMSSVSQESENLFEPSLSKMGMRWFFSYSLWLVVIHHLALFFLESFSIAQIGNTLMRTFFSIIFTQLSILLLMLMFKSVSKKTERMA